eukprot:164659-Pleurochrysis_carterae.AAC.5
MPMPIQTAAAAACHLCGLAASSWRPRAGRGGSSTGSAGRASASRCCHRRCSAVAAMIAPWHAAALMSHCAPPLASSGLAYSQSHASITSCPSSSSSTISRSACSRACRPPGAACWSWRTPSALATSASKSPAMHAHACAYAFTARRASPLQTKGIPRLLPRVMSMRAVRPSTGAVAGATLTFPAGRPITKRPTRDGSCAPVVSMHSRAAVPRPASPASSSRYAHGPIMSAKQTSTAATARGPTAATSMSSVYCSAATSLA